MKYNFSTNAVDVFGTESITDDEATAKQLTDEAELVKTVKAAEAKKIADMAG